MKHLKENNTNYFMHLAHAWVMAIVLIIHGVIPCILTDWVSKRICNGTDWRLSNVLCYESTLW